MQLQKPYVGYKDLMECGLSESRAYKVLNDAMISVVDDRGKKVPWCDTYECELVNGKTGKKAPAELVLKKLPFCKKFLGKTKKKDAPIVQDTAS